MFDIFVFIIYEIYVFVYICRVKNRETKRERNEMAQYWSIFWMQVWESLGDDME